MTIHQAVSYFITALEAEQLSKHSIRAYEQDLNQFCAIVTKITLEDLTFQDFQEYFIQINNLKAASLKRKRVVLHRFFKFCYKKHLSREKLYDYIDPIKSKKVNIPKEILTKEDIRSIDSYLNAQKLQYKQKINEPYYAYLYYCSVRNRLLTYILLYTGCRAHEVVAIKKADIHFENNTLTLFTKGQKYNQVPLHEQLLEAFKHYDEAINILEDEVVRTMLNSNYLFPSKSCETQHLSTRALHDLMHALSKVLNKRVHAHLFRHTFASYCIASHMDIATISSLISHSNPSITLSIYTHEIDAYNKQEQIKKLRFN